MRQLSTWTLLAAILAASATGIGLASGSDNVAAGSPDAIVCPATGEEIAKDDCPLVDRDRADCPGKIECPLTGELVCSDRCPLDAEAAQAPGQVSAPDCCRTK